MTKSHAATVCVCGGIRLWELAPPRLAILADEPDTSAPKVGCESDASKADDSCPEATGLGLIVDADQGQECRGSAGRVGGGGEAAAAEEAQAQAASDA
jgi:hypothetical protein